MYNPTSEIQITKLLQGMKRLNHKSDRRLLITKNILDFFTLPSSCTNSFEVAFFSAAFALAIHYLFRVGDLTVKFLITLYFRGKT